MIKMDGLKMADFKYYAGILEKVKVGKGYKDHFGYY